jgi:hypothetical protein
MVAIGVDNFDQADCDKTACAVASHRNDIHLAILAAPVPTRGKATGPFAPRPARLRSCTPIHRSRVCRVASPFR